ncbi:MAG: SLC13 family permease [Eubacteriales bacterium]|nr:SLC13 family permease [Eubacteriales bacterium]
MTIQLFGAILGVVVFILILMFRLPNWLTYVAVAPIVVFTGAMTTKEVYAVFSSSGLQLMYIICIFMGLMTATGLDSIIGNTVVTQANKVAHGDEKKMERMLLLVLFVFGNIFSFFLANNHVAMALVPVIYGIAKRTKLSYSKMILFVIFSTTIGGACTLVGTTSNVYANTALLDSGLKGLGMFDFAWVGVPVMILGGIYLIFCNKMCPSYEETVPGDAQVLLEAGAAASAEMRKKQHLVCGGFVLFLIGMVADSVMDLPGFSPYFFGYGIIAILYFFKVAKPKQFFTSISSQLVLFCAGINLAIAIINITPLGDIFSNFFITAIGESDNLYVITAILWAGTVVMTQFMNNMACAGVLAPVAIGLSEHLGADPRAMVMAIAMAATSSYLTPMASGTNQLLMPFTNLKFQDFARYGWPLLIINFICCMLILPVVFPFF